MTLLAAPQAAPERNEEDMGQELESVNALRDVIYRVQHLASALTGHAEVGVEGGVADNTRHSDMRLKNIAVEAAALAVAMESHARELRSSSFVPGRPGHRAQAPGLVRLRARVEALSELWPQLEPSMHKRSRTAENAQRLREELDQLERLVEHHARLLAGWRDSGHPLIEALVVRMFDLQPYTGKIVLWLPPEKAPHRVGKEDDELFHVVYEDDDEEDLDHPIALRALRDAAATEEGAETPPLRWRKPPPLADAAWRTEGHPWIGCALPIGADHGRVVRWCPPTPKRLVEWFAVALPPEAVGSGSIPGTTAADGGEERSEVDGGSIEDATGAARAHERVRGVGIPLGTVAIADGEAEAVAVTRAQLLAAGAGAFAAPGAVRGKRSLNGAGRGPAPKRTAAGARVALTRAAALTLPDYGSRLDEARVCHACRNRRNLDVIVCGSCQDHGIAPISTCTRCIVVLMPDAPLPRTYAVDDAALQSWRCQYCASGARSKCGCAACATGGVHAGLRVPPAGRVRLSKEAMRNLRLVARTASHANGAGPRAHDADADGSKGHPPPPGAKRASATGVREGGSGRRGSSGGATLSDVGSTPGAADDDWSEPAV